MTSAASLGILPEDAFQKALDAPAGAAIKIIQKFDPLWGLDQKYRGLKLKKFRAECKQKKIIEQFCTIEFEAYTEDHAHEILNRLPDSRFDWDDGDEYEDDFHIRHLGAVKQ